MTSSRRALVLPLLVPLLAAGLAGCGGSDDKDKDGSSAGKAPTRAQAEAAAKAINLTKADMSGYASEPADNSEGGDDGTDKELAECLGIEESDDLVDLSSDDFSKGAPPSGSQVSSNVSVVASEEDVEAELAAFGGDKAAGCFQKVLGAGLKEQVDQPGVTFGELKVAKATPVEGTDGAFAYTLTTEVAALGIKVPISFTVDGFLVKHSEVSLLTVTYGSSASKGERDRLLGLLVERAKGKAV